MKQIRYINIISSDKKYIFKLGVRKEDQEYGLFDRAELGSGNYVVGDVVNLGGYLSPSHYFLTFEKATTVFFYDAIDFDASDNPIFKILVLPNGYEIWSEFVLDYTLDDKMEDLRGSKELDIATKIIGSIKFK